MGIKPTLYSLGLLTTSLGGVSHGYPKQPLGGDSTSSKDPNRKQSLSGLRPLKKRGGQQADGYLNNLSPWCEVLLPFCFVSLLCLSSLSLLLLCHSAFETPWTAVHQAAQSCTISWSLLKCMSIELVVPSNHLILSSPSPPAFNYPQYQSLFQ